MKPLKNKANVITLIKLLILAAILYWIYATFPEEHWNTLVTQEKNWLLLCNALLVVIAANVVSFWRWKVLVNAIGVPLSLMQAIRLGFLGTTLNLVSVGAVGGDLFKAIAAAQQAGKKKAEVVTSVLVDRAIGLLGLVILAAISLVLAGSISTTLNWIRNGALLLSGIGIGGLACIVLVGHKLPIRWFSKVPGIGHLLYRIAHACLVFQGKPRLVLELVSSTVCIHSMLTIGCWLISNGLYSAPPTLEQHFQAVPPALAAATLPLTPGGVGVQEVAIRKLFEELPNLPAGFSGLIVAVVYRAILVVIAVIGAVVYFTGNDRKQVERFQSHESS